MIQFDGVPIREEIIDAMILHLAHRGPDGSGTKVHGAMGLGHRRLSIIDPAGGAQPMCNEDGRVWISYNGELYNYKELRSELQGRGHHFVSNSDTETVIHAYEEWGDSCVERFRGMFAFGIMDLREGRLFLARDQLGIKPLFYARTKTGLAFASELKPLCLVPDVCLELDHAAIDQYLWLQYVPAPGTALAGIRKLPPAHRMSIWLDGRGGESQEYWTLDFSPDHSLTEDDWIEEIDSLMRESVQTHLVSDVPFGAFLSGGVDSSLVVANMARLLEKPVKTFSIGFEESDYNELPYARFVADQVKAEHVVEIVKPDALDMLPQLVAHYGDLFGDSSAIPTYYVSRLARKHVSMVLSGDGADEAFAGYWSYGNWLRALAEHGEQAAVLPHWLSLINYIDVPTRAQLWRPEYRHACSEFLDVFEREFARTSAFSPCHKAQYMDFKTYLPYDILTKVDVASMMNSLEVRTPFVDIRVAERAARIPEHFSIAKNARGEWERKLLLKKVAARYFPEAFVSRPKMGFAVPLAKWFAPGGLLRPHLEERLLGSGSLLHSLFEPSVMRALVEKIATGPLWLLLYCEEWLRQQKEWRAEQLGWNHQNRSIPVIGTAKVSNEAIVPELDASIFDQKNGSRSMVRPRILLIADVPDWIFERHCFMLKKFLADEFDFTIIYANQSYCEEDYDLIYPLEWYLVRPEQIGNPRKYVSGIRSHLVWTDYAFEDIARHIGTIFSCVHVVSKKLYDIFAPHISNLRYVTHGIDTDFFAPTTAPNQSGFRLKIGWAGNRKSVGKKGFAEFIEPLGKLPGVDLIFCGYSDRNLTIDEIKVFYDSLDVYVCASDFEGSNNSLLEAASMARAIITTDNGTVPEYLVNNESALIVERTAEAFVRAALFLRDNPELRVSFGNKARESVVARWAWHKKAEEFRIFFKEALMLQAKTTDSAMKDKSSVLLAVSHFWPSIGGLETIAEQLALGLVNKGFAVTVLTFFMRERQAEDWHGVKIISVDPSQASIDILAFSDRLVQEVTSGVYAACIVMQDPLGSMIWALEGNTVPPGTRLIIQPIINAEGYAKWKDNQNFKERLAAILRKADAAVTLTRTGIDDVFLRSCGLTPLHIPNAVEVLPSSTDFRQRYKIPESNFLLLHVANVYHVKNHIGLLKTIGELPEGWSLVMIGYPFGEQECVLEFLEALPSYPAVKYIPGLPRDETAAAMTAADVILLSSNGEGSPVSILEAMALSKPWLATPQCGAAIENAGGIIAGLEDFPVILSILFSRPELRNYLGKIGNDHWKSCFTWEKVISRWTSLIRAGKVDESCDEPPHVAMGMKLVCELMEEYHRESTFGLTTQASGQLDV